MKANLYKKVLGLTLGAALAGAVGAAAQSAGTNTNSAKTENQAAANGQDKQDKQSCPMMKGMKMENMDMPEMKGMDMSEMKDMKMQNMKDMDMSKMMENCKKMGGMNGKQHSDDNKKSEQ